jgi:hypothetical protein
MKLSYRYFYVSHRKIKIRFYDFGSYWKMESIRTKESK